jgi:hypothetical protein
MTGLFAVLLLVGFTTAQDKPQDVVKRAIAAHGGEAALKKYPAGSSKIAGKLTMRGLNFTGNMLFSVPGKVRIEMVFEFNDDKTGKVEKARLVQVINGDKVIQTENNKASALTDKVKEELRESAAIQELALLYPLLDDKKYALAAGKDGEFAGKECFTIVVKAPGLREVTLAFDKQTGYLTAMQRKGLSPTQDSVDELTTFSDYKTIDGLVVPMKSKISHNGNPFLEITVLEYKPLTKVDDSKFTTD